MTHPEYTKNQQPNSNGDLEVPADWECRRLKFSVTYNDENLPENTDPDYLIAYVDISSVDLVSGIKAVEEVTFEKAPSRARRIVRDGDTIISTVRTYLKAITPIKNPPENMIVSTGFAVIRPYQTINERFLGYVLQNANFVSEVVANSTGVSYPAINPSKLVCIPISYPKNNTEQKKIADFLDWKTGQIDALISKKKQLIEKLKEKRTALITKAVTKGLNPDAPMRDSGIPWLGKVPAHWDVLSIKRLTPVSRGASPRPIEDPRYFDDEGEYAWVRIADVTSNDHYLRETTQRLSELGKSLSVPLEPGSLFLSIAGSVGKPMITAIKACIHDGFVYFPQLQINSEYLFYIFESGQPYLGLGKLGTQLNLNTDTVGNIKIGLPQNDEQQQIVDFLDLKLGHLDALVAQNKQLIKKLTEYRTALITAATTGKIDVRNVKIGGAA